MELASNPQVGTLAVHGNALLLLAHVCTHICTHVHVYVCGMLAEIVPFD